MIHTSCFCKKLLHLCTSSCLKLACLSKSSFHPVACFYRLILLRASSFFIQLAYFLFISFLGFLLLKFLDPRTDSFRPRNLDLFFTAVSAATVSSMSTVEMEVFSNSQLIVMTILMFIGGEVFTSMIGIYFRKLKLERVCKIKNDGVPVPNDIPNNAYQVELSMVNNRTANSESLHNHYQWNSTLLDSQLLIYRSTKVLGFLVLSYLVVVQIIGIALVLLYLALASSARNVLKKKGLNLFIFSVFTVVSTFTNCGFVPTNENMMVFRKNSLLLLILIPQVLFGNTLYPCCLRFSVWFLGKFFKKEESNYLLKDESEIGYRHLLPSLDSWLLVVTVFGFIVLQFVLFCSMEWNADSLSGLNSYQKIIGVLFQTVNAKHAGESIVDLSIISSAMLVLFVVMMYLPPYTYFLPVKDDGEHGKRKKSRGKFLENIMMSQLSYLVIFIILVCVTERHKMKEDPLNFNVLNVVVEIISAYGSVGFTTGYSCKRQLHPNNNCVDKLYGFSGWWSDGGKIILIVVMFWGRLKNFNMDGGKAWILS